MEYQRKKPIIRFSIALFIAVFFLTSGGSSVGVQPSLAQNGEAASDEQILDEYEGVRQATQEADLGEKGKGAERSLLAKLDSSQKHFEKENLCQAIHHADLVLDELVKLRDREGANVSALDAIAALAHNLRHLLLQDPRAAECEGAEQAGIHEPIVEIAESSNTQFSFAVQLPLPKLTTQTEEEETFTQVHVEGVDNQIGEVGTPAVPMWRTIIGVPHGATPQIMSVTPQLGGEIQMLLLPYQPQPVDQEIPPEDEVTPEPAPETFANPPFEINREAYAQNTQVPPNPCTVQMIGQARDLPMAQVECATGQYNPATQIFEYYDSFELEIAFEGGNGAFVSSRSQSVFEPQTAQYTSSVLNSAAINQHVFELVPPGFCFGEELLILTHPDFRDAADRLADWKRDKGIMTNVFNVNDGEGSGPDSAASIDDFIEERYDDCNVRPSYVLLMGDAEYIPTFYVETSGSDTTGSDYQYAVYPQGFFDIVPDFGVGRIPVDTLAQADVVVDKIIGYEASPPTFGAQASTFYGSAAIASQFQCCRGGSQPVGTTQRTFTEVSEFARNVLVGAGKSVDRIYHETVDGDYSGDSTPRRYYDGDFLPFVLGPSGSYDWTLPESTRTQELIDSWNDGRFLVLHRDHGWEHGWGNPYFDSNHVSGDLNNGAFLPVVYSVNCASGLFDNETANGDYGTTQNGVYFAERLLRKADGGAIGVLGDTRNSPSWPNTALTMGFVDATWPNARPEFGNNTSQRRLGDILNHGKLFMLTQIGVPGAGVSAESAISELFMWHVIGDPTLEMRTNNPFNISTIFEAEIGPEFINVFYEEPDAEITAYQLSDNEGLKPIARGVIEMNGVATLPYFEAPTEDEPILLSACIEDGVCRLLNPQPEPEGGDLHGVKYEDRNGNGTRDEGEPGLADWEIVLSAEESEDVLTTMTDENGAYSFTGVAPGSYEVSETQQNGWFQTEPTVSIHGVELKEGDVIEGLNFGNQQTVE